MSKLVGARVYNDANISVANANFQALTFNQEDFDDDTIHSTSSNTSRLTCQTAGNYVIVGHFQFSSNTTGIRIVKIQLNGTTDIVQYRDEMTTNTYTEMNIVCIYELSAADYVELLAYQNSGGALNVNVQSGYSPVFSMHRIG